MISCIIVQSAEARDAFANVVSLEKKETGVPGIFVYKRSEWILVYGQDQDIYDLYNWTIESYNPEKIYLPFFGFSVDLTHEVGDVILPNVFLSYDDQISQAELTEDNRDQFLGTAKFLEIYNEQKDYYVEDYGLSIGGIVVDTVPEVTSDELNSRLMLAYEADIYTRTGLTDLYNITLDSEAIAVILGGIIEGKLPKNISGSNIDHTVRCMMTTIRLLEGQE